MSGLAKTGRFCLNCYFYEPGGEPLATIAAAIAGETEVGTCQRMPPTVGIHRASVWPSVNRARGCGEWVTDDASEWRDDDEDDDPPPGGEEARPPLLGLVASNGRRVQ